MKTITNNLLAGLLRTAFERGYMAGNKQLIERNSKVPVTAEQYRNEVRSAGNEFLDLHYPQLLGSRSSQQLQIEESAKL